MTVYLLDVNALLAFCDDRHVHHESAHRWFGRIGSKQWATCPITENGFLRIFGNPNYPNYPGNPAVVLRMLRQLRDQVGYHFWPDSKSILEWLVPEANLFPNHITDIYLLGLAASHGGKLATFDRKIPIHAVAGGPKAVELLG